MSNNKNYLDQLAQEVENKRPASFSEEKFERVQKQGVSLDPKVIVIALIVIVLVLVGSYFAFFRASITMPDFVGQGIDDMSAWVKQEQIESVGIVVKEEYNFEYDEEVIIEQSIAPGEKVNKDVKITFTSSLGPDPDEEVAFLENILSLTRSDIEEWEDENKLEDVNIDLLYSDTIPEGQVISFDLHGASADSFTRGDKVTFKVSRGPQPAGTITMQDFVDKTQAEVEAFAKTNELVLEVIEVYNDEVAKGIVITQSVASGKTIKEGETLVITVSKGSSIVLPNFVGYTSDELSAWTSDPKNSITIIKKEIHSNSGNGTVIAQNLGAGTQLESGEVVELTISLGLPQLQTNSRQWLGSDYLALVAWVDEANAKGAGLSVGPWIGEEYSDTYSTPGQIIEYVCYNADGTQIVTGCDRPLPIGSKIGYKVSLGSESKTPETTAGISLSGKTYDDFKSIAQANGITIVEQIDSSLADGVFIVYDSTLSNVIYNSAGVENGEVFANTTYIVKTK